MNRFIIDKDLKIVIYSFSNNAPPHKVQEHCDATSAKLKDIFGPEYRILILPNTEILIHETDNTSEV